jgi:hypothetical protein
LEQEDVKGNGRDELLEIASSSLIWRRRAEVLREQIFLILAGR